MGQIQSAISGAFVAAAGAQKVSNIAKTEEDKLHEATRANAFEELAHINTELPTSYKEYGEAERRVTELETEQKQIQTKMAHYQKGSKNYLAAESSLRALQSEIEGRQSQREALGKRIEFLSGRLERAEGILEWEEGMVTPKMSTKGKEDTKTGGKK